MTALEALRRAREAGVELSVRHGQVGHCGPIEALAPDVRAALHQQAAEVVRLLEAAARAGVEPVEAAVMLALDADLVDCRVGDVLVPYEALGVGTLPVPPPPPRIPQPTPDAEATMPNYKSLFPSKWLKAEDLNGGSRELTIAGASVEEVGTGERAAKKLVVHFQEDRAGAPAQQGQRGSDRGTGRQRRERGVGRDTD